MLGLFQFKVINFKASQLLIKKLSQLFIKIASSFLNYALYMLKEINSLKFILNYSTEE